MIGKWLIKARRYPLVQRVIVNSGLVSVCGVEHPKELTSLAVIPPFAVNWHTHSAEQKTNLVSNCVSLFIHNAINSNDFPVNAELTALLIELEVTIKSLHRNAWRTLFERVGETGCAPDRIATETLTNTEQLLLSGHWKEWEDNIAPVTEDITLWFIKNIDSIQVWHEKRLAPFS